MSENRKNDFNLCIRPNEVRQAQYQYLLDKSMYHFVNVLMSLGSNLPLCAALHVYEMIFRGAAELVSPWVFQRGFWLVRDAGLHVDPHP